MAERRGDGGWGSQRAPYYRFSVGPDDPETLSDLERELEAEREAASSTRAELPSVRQSRGASARAPSRLRSCMQRFSMGVATPPQVGHSAPVGSCVVAHADVHTEISGPAAAEGRLAPSAAAAAPPSAAEQPQPPQPPQPPPVLPSHAEMVYEEVVVVGEGGPEVGRQQREEDEREVEQNGGLEREGR